MKKPTMFILLLLITVFLTACGYPQSERAENQIPYEDQLITVQNAVNQYRGASGGLLPIKTRDMEVDQYIKYPIDFSKIVPDYTAEVPTNAFETGGIFQYVLMDVEENPTVKLVDLQAAEAIRSVNVRKSANGGKAPISEILADNVYKFNHDAMGFSEEPTVVSPYSGRNLPMVITGSGDVYIDYSMDLYSALQEYEGELEAGQDIRFILYEDHAVVPAYSLPYTINEDNEPVFLTE
ncbi:hypothetical protein QL992_02010 [Microbacterium sp. APC 3898]|jgi:hypothetical protein|uniref:Lipoprotein n=2 Tax=Planococcus TaxID=1372 RepID=A0ABT7ZGL2_9BACL|nr:MULTISPECIES: hypothetical protein [Terrabacteria group]MBD8014034.1 hypothetical protein [Planococcus wigleyi]MDN3426274.1 hypothetical protein [Planococcus sp. APC 4016]MDN3438885.1 hypothetical protein [Planococcus sp. APC 3900]MDN3497970.1 hypothetical protein [Microbacterium sp. APC 3898]